VVPLVFESLALGRQLPGRGYALGGKGNIAHKLHAEHDHGARPRSRWMSKPVTSNGRSDRMLRSAFRPASRALRKAQPARKTTCREHPASCSMSLISTCRQLRWGYSRGHGTSRMPQCPTGNACTTPELPGKCTSAPNVVHPCRNKSSTVPPERRLMRPSSDGLDRGLGQRVHIIPPLAFETSGSTTVGSDGT